MTGQRLVSGWLPGCLCALALIVLLSVPAVAGQRLALVIGNGGYAGGPLAPLRNPTNDAVLISETIKRTGFDVTLVMDADLRAMKRAVSAFAARLSEAGPDARDEAEQQRCEEQHPR